MTDPQTLADAALAYAAEVEDALKVYREAEAAAYARLEAARGGASTNGHSPGPSAHRYGVDRHHGLQGMDAPDRGRLLALYDRAQRVGYSRKGDVKRRDLGVLVYLSEHPDMTSGDVADKLGMTRWQANSTCTRLRDEGLVDFTTKGRAFVHRVPPNVMALIDPKEGS